MIATLIALGVFITILIVTMWRGRDLGQPLAQRVRTVILGVLIATAVAAAILYPIVLIPPVVLTLMASPIVIPYAIYVHRRHREGFAEAWAHIAETRRPAPANPYVTLYANWNVRKRPDNTYAVLPLILDRNKALQPRWEAADPTVFADPVEAWSHAIELTRMHSQMKAITSTSE